MFTVVCTTGDIRLRDGATNYEGRVEICYNNAWGTVCQDGWTFHESIVACRQLGLSGIGKFDSIAVVRPGKIIFIHTRGVASIGLSGLEAPLPAPLSFRSGLSGWVWMYNSLA